VKIEWEGPCDPLTTGGRKRMKYSKNMRVARERLDRDKLYSPKEAV
jgi:hypothetical protein